MQSLSVIVPTYNESNALPPLLDRLEPVLSRLSLTTEVLVVDDASPDGTAAVAQEENTRRSIDVRVLVRDQNPGLGPSVVDGFRHARGDYCLVMDADLQHPPERIPAFIDAFQDEGADVVIGSRRATGGAYGDWSISRRLISNGADITARAMLPAARRTTDPMSGFFAIRRAAIAIDELEPKGFKILLEILASDDTLSTTEVGFEFGIREHGESKLDAKESIEFLEHLATRRLADTPITRFISSERAITMAEFGLIGAMGVAVNTVVFTLVLSSNAHYALAGLVAFLVAVQWNFVGNWILTFNESDGGFFHQYVKFHGVSLGGLVVYQVFLGVTLGLLTFPPTHSNLLAISAGAIWNYFGAEQVAFAPLR